jgi:hypothetical protein
MSSLSVALSGRKQRLWQRRRRGVRRCAPAAPPQQAAAAQRQRPEARAGRERHVEPGLARVRR